MLMHLIIVYKYQEATPPSWLNRIILHLDIYYPHYYRPNIVDDSLIFFFFVLLVLWGMGTLL